MHSLRMPVIALAAFSTALIGEISFNGNTLGGSPPVSLTLGIETAHAAPRNVARRTSRRTSRRVAARNSVAGCSPYRAYYNCGGIYYQPVVQGGSTVYVVVNP